jgi:hypothetical protein
MKRTQLALCFLLISAWLGVADPRGLAAQLVPLGPEVDLLADTFPYPPFLAVQPDGSYVVAWDEGTSSVLGIFYRYVAAGSKPAEEWPSTMDPYVYPKVGAVTATPNGFDVLSYNLGDDDEPPGFYRHHLNLRGVPDDKPIRLGGAGIEWVWHVRGNGFMAGWTLRGKHGIAARRLTSTGQQTGPELSLNSRPIDFPHPVVLAVADGGFLAVWHGFVPGPTSTAVLRARRFTPKGKPLGPDFDVTTIPGSDFQVAVAPGGGFAVAWTLGDKIYLRLFDAAGIALGPEIPAVMTSEDLFRVESMAFDKSGNLLLLWNVGYVDLRLQLIDSHGAPLGPPVRVRSKASDIFREPWGGHVAWAGNSWLVAWVAQAVPTRDFSGVFVRRFAIKK